MATASAAAAPAAAAAVAVVLLLRRGWTGCWCSRLLGVTLMRRLWCAATSAQRCVGVLTRREGGVRLGADSTRRDADCAQSVMHCLSCNLLRHLGFTPLSRHFGMLPPPPHTSHLTPQPHVHLSAQVPHSLPAGIQSRLSFIPGSSSLLLFTSPCLGPTALLFDFRVGQPLRELRLTGCPASLAVAPSGGMFAFGLAGRGVLLADAAAESSLELRPCGGGGGAGGSTTSSTAVQAVAFAAGGRKLLCAVGGLITVWDA